jgi:hypothetical protein
MAEIDRYKLVRSVVIQHLERHCTAAATSGESKATCHKTSVAVYEALDSERFQDYLRSNAIHFFFCHEGFKECSNAKIEINTALRYLMYRLVSRGYHIAFLNDVSFQSSKVCSHKTHTFLHDQWANISFC